LIPAKKSISFSDNLPKDDKIIDHTHHEEENGSSSPTKTNEVVTRHSKFPDNTPFPRKRSFIQIPPPLNALQPIEQEKEQPEESVEDKELLTRTISALQAGNFSSELKDDLQIVLSKGKQSVERVKIALNYGCKKNVGRSNENGISYKRKLRIRRSKNFH